MLNDAEALDTFDTAGWTFMCSGDKAPVYPAVCTGEFLLGIFYKAGDGKVIKCGREKLQNYDILVNECKEIFETLKSNVTEIGW